MPTYAPVSAFAERKSYPRALIVIAAGQAGLIAAVMLAKMDLPHAVLPTVTRVDLIEAPKPPPPNPTEPQRTPEPAPSVIDRPIAIVPVPADSAPAVDSAANAAVEPAWSVGAALQPRVDIAAKPLPVRTGPRFATPDSRLRPPYPPHKINSGEEAALRLKLSIDERGRVTAVEPAGNADAAFLGSARRHLVAHWRYQPATEGGRPVASSTVITLRFRLGD